MGQTTILPPPYKGENYQLPKAVVESPYCERLINFKALYGAAAVRFGNARYRLSTATRALTIDSYDKSTPELYHAVYLSGTGLLWINSATGAIVRTKALNTAFYMFTLFYDNYLMYFGDIDMVAGGAVGPQYYDGSAWGNLGYTWPASFNPYGGCVYKNRAYFIQQSASAYGYSGINSFSGTVTKVSLDDIVSSKSELYLIRSLSLTENVNANNVLAFILSSGEVLVYEGTYPDSPTWRIVSRFQISSPIFYNSAIDAKGDSFILTKSEILSLRNLYTNGYSVERATGIGSAIQPRWQQIVDAWVLGVGSSILSYFNGCYDQANDRLIINTPGYVDPETGEASYDTLQLIYDFKLGSWYEYTQYALTNTASFMIGAKTCFHDRKVFWNGYDGNNSIVVQLEGKTDFLDDSMDSTGTQAQDYELVTAPLPINKYGAICIDGVEIITKSDLYAQTNIKWIADLGRQESEGQPCQDMGTSIAKPMYNVGINGATLLQLSISGSTVANKEIGLQIYSMNVWYNKGQEGSR